MGCIHSASMWFLPVLPFRRIGLPSRSPHGDDCDLIFVPGCRPGNKQPMPGWSTGSRPWSPSTALLVIRRARGGAVHLLKTTAYLRQLKSCRTSGTWGITEEFTVRMAEMNLMRLRFFLWPHYFPIVSIAQMFFCSWQSFSLKSFFPSYCNNSLNFFLFIFFFGFTLLSSFLFLFCSDSFLFLIATWMLVPRGTKNSDFGDKMQAKW